jgi:hypothetical protein
MRHSFTRNLLGWFLAIFLIVGITLQVAHTHSDFGAHPDCAFCHVVHGNLQPSVPPLSASFTRPVARIVVAPQPGYSRQICAFSLWNRPPPGTASFS